METESTGVKVMQTHLEKLLGKTNNNFNINKVLNRDLTIPENSIPIWGDLGFLDGLKDEEKIKTISVSMSLAVKYILLGNNSEIYPFDSKIEIFVFPIMRRILQNEDLNLIYNFEKISTFVECLLIDLNENIKKFDFDFKGSGIDSEAAFCAMYCDNFDVKKYFE